MFLKELSAVSGLSVCRVNIFGPGVILDMLLQSKIGRHPGFRRLDLIVQPVESPDSRF